jgi:flagellar biosynthesis/type III secretory pathway protein FliH
MPDGFVPLASFLRPVVVEPVVPSLPVSTPAAGASDEAIARAGTLEAEYDENLCAARRFRAALADALEVGVARLLREIANDVLVRELRLASADVASIVVHALARFDGEKVLSLRVHPSELGRLRELEFEKIADESLAPGDAVIELHSGTIDLRLPARLEAALSAASTP